MAKGVPVAPTSSCPSVQPETANDWLKELRRPVLRRRSRGVKLSHGKGTPRKGSAALLVHGKSRRLPEYGRGAVLHTQCSISLTLGRPKPLEWSGGDTKSASCFRSVIDGKRNKYQSLRKKRAVVSMSCERPPQMLRDAAA